MNYRFFGPAAALLALSIFGQPADAQTRPARKPAAKTQAKRPAKPAAQSAAAAEPGSFYTTYAYRSYIIYSDEETEPTPANGVGGTLTLLPDGTYQKRLRLAGSSGPVSFDQDGQFVLKGDQITFTHPGPDGQPRIDQGSFRLDAPHHRLVLTIEGYPVGSRGVYTLEEQRPADAR